MYAPPISIKPWTALLLAGGAMLAPAAAGAQTPDGRSLPGPCAEGADPLGPLHSWHDRVRQGTSRCLAVELRPGEGLRAVVAMDARPPLTGVTAQLFAPGATTPVVQAVLGNDDRRALALRSEDGGTYHLVLRDAWTIDGTVAEGVPLRAWIEAIEPPALVDARRAAIAVDPRVSWLRDHTHRLDTINPEHDDDSDLEPLRAMLDGVRIVMLGESSHSAGAEFAARSRIVRFLHRELGFDVLAFEAGMFGMAAADDAMRAGMPAAEAFALGAWPFWARATEMQPLISHIGEAAAGERPLRLAGFDINFVRPGAAERFPVELATFLHASGIASPLADPSSEEHRILTAVAMLHYRTGEQRPPPPEARTAFLDAVDRAISELDAMQPPSPGPDDTTALWSRFLDTTREAARFAFEAAGDGGIWAASRLRNAAMAENLRWLAQDRFPDRRIIVWAANAHVMRLPEIPPAGGEGPSAGYRVAGELGAKSFVLVATSFEGPGFSSEQHVLPDVETLMAQAGLHAAILDLRDAARRSAWAGGPFLARAITQAPEERTWSELADGLLFIRRFEPARPAR